MGGFIFFSSAAHAVEATWTGAGGGGSVLNGANWNTDPNPPALNDNLVFPFVTNRLVTVDTPTFTVGHINFTNATNFSFNGSGSPTLVLMGDVTLQNTNVNFLSSLQVQLEAGGHTLTNDSSSVFETDAVISGAGTLVKSGSGMFSIHSVSTYTGGTTVSEGTLDVDATHLGSASISHASSDTVVGGTNTGTLRIVAGGTVTNALGKVGQNSGETGVVVVKDAGSTWTSSGGLYVGNGGIGTLYLYDGGKVNVDSGSGTLHLGHSATGAGMLKIGTDGEGYFTGGVINASEITTGAGLSGELRFATNGTAANPYYLTKDGTSNGAAVLISGPTEVQQAHGFTVLKSGNTYSGATQVSGGTLIVSDENALGSSTVTVNGGTLVVNDINFYNTLNLSSGTLAGIGYVPEAHIGTSFTLSPGLPANGGHIGNLEFAHLELGGGGTMEWNLQNPNGTAGSGWDQVSISTPTTLEITATSGNRFTLKLISLDTNGAPGTATGFIPGQEYSWLVFNSDYTTGFDAAAFDLNLSQFSTDSELSSLTLVKTGHDLYLKFTPVPEPSTYVLLALGLGATSLAAWRKRRQA